MSTTQSIPSERTQVQQQQQQTSYVPTQIRGVDGTGSNNTVPSTFVYPPAPPSTTIKPNQQQQQPMKTTVLSGLKSAAVIDPPDIYNSVKDLRFFRIPMYILTLVDLFATVLLVIVTIRWTAPDLNIPLLYLFLMLLQIPHLFTSPAMLAVILDSRNFYFINMVAVIVGIAWAADFIGLVWRSVCLAYEGSLTCPIISPGRWLAWTVWGLVFVLVITSTIVFILLIFYIRGLKRNLIMEFDVLDRQREQQQLVSTLQTTAATDASGGDINDTADSRNAISFRQSAQLYFSRSRIRALAGSDLFLYAFATLIRILFLYGVGFWYTPYLQATHLFLWLWMLDIGGSIDYKTPIYLGGTDASRSELLVQITFYAFIAAVVLDFAAFLLCAWDVLVVTLSVFTILEIFFGYILLVLYILFVAYDIYSIYSLSTLLTHVSRFAINKQHYQ